MEPSIRGHDSKCLNQLCLERETTTTIMRKEIGVKNLKKRLTGLQGNVRRLTALPAHNVSEGEGGGCPLTVGGLTPTSRGE